MSLGLAQCLSSDGQVSSRWGFVIGARVMAKVVSFSLFPFSFFLTLILFSCLCSSGSPGLSW